MEYCLVVVSWGVGYGLQVAGGGAIQKSYINYIKYSLDPYNQLNIECRTGNVELRRRYLLNKFILYVV